MFEIPLNRGGKKYNTNEKEDLISYKNEKFGKISQTPEAIINIDAIKNTKKSGFSNLRNLDEKELLKIIKEAGEIFWNKNSLKNYFEDVVSATGLPLSSVERSSEMLKSTMKNMDKILESQTPDRDLELFDNPRGKRNFAYIPKGKNLGVIAPGNHPATNTLWLITLGMKYPNIIKPSNEEPLTINRITNSLYEAGLPEKSLYFLPGKRSIGEKIIDKTDKGIVFGNENTINNFENNRDIKTFGPGNSKIFIDEEYINDSTALKLAKNSMMQDGGKGCINISQIVTKNNSKELSKNLAEEIKNIEFEDPLNKEAQIPAMKPEQAKSIDKYIENNLAGAKDCTSQFKKRLEEKDGINYLNPTVIHIEKDGKNHPLFTELPFQYSVITDYEEGILDNSLVLAMITDDEEKIEKALMNPNIEKVYVGTATCDIKIKEPHEGFLTDFLYKKKAFRKAKSYK